MSRSDNPDAELQKQVGLLEQSQNYWGFVHSTLEAAQSQLSAGMPEFRNITLEGYVQSIKGHTQIYKRILDGADIDDVENFILSTQDAGSNLAELLAAFSDRARQSAGPQQTSTQPGAVEPPGISPGNDSAGLPGITG